jgi:archaemetzincin
MKRLQILSVGELDGVVVEGLAVELANHFGLPCEVLAASIDPQFAFHGERRQYHSRQILRQMAKFLGPQTWRLLAVSGNDLYIPILTFVLGEAQMGGPCALGHTLELTHCDCYRCAMSASHSVELIDLKESAFCSQCADRVMALTRNER